MNAIESYLEHFRHHAETAPAAVDALRQRAIACFSAAGFPTTRQEDWKYTNLATLAGEPFRPAPATSTGSADVDALLLGGGTCELVFVNGLLQPFLGSPAALPPGVIVTDLASAMSDHPELLADTLASCAAPEGASLTALNTAFLRDGAFIFVPRDTVVETPIHLLYATACERERIVCHPRTLIVLESSAAAVVIEQHVSLSGGTYWNNTVTEAVVGANARLTHYKMQRESPDAFHIATIAARQAADSYFRSHAVSLGARLARHDITTRYEARGGECSFDGLYLLNGEQHVDYHTTIDHAQPRCASKELYKGILDGRSTAVFNGKVIVRSDAQGTDAQQLNKNLLLSEHTEIDTKPQLEIFADDVKCSHGATVGRLDEESLFYLRSRGLDETTARGLLTFAFANELVERVDVKPWRLRLERLIRAHFAESALDGMTP